MIIPEAALRALAEHGLRCDMTPTHDMSSLDASEAFWHEYLLRADKNVRRIASLALDQMRAVPSPPDSSQPIDLRKHPSSPQVAVAEAYIVKFDDTDKDDVLFYGEFAERAALEFFDQSQLNWSCYLFRCIAGPHPRAASPQCAAAPQSAPKPADDTKAREGEPPVELQARHWNQAVADWANIGDADVIGPERSRAVWIEQRARSLAQADAKGDK